MKSCLVSVQQKLNLDTSVIRNLEKDGRLLFLSRFMRLFSYGFLSVGLLLYLSEVGLSPIEVGYLLTGILVGDIIISFFITTEADRIGRKKMLMIGGLLKVFAGVIFAISGRFFVLLMFAGIFGVISPSGGEIGPFLPIEQAALSQMVPSSSIPKVFAWYNLVGYVSAAIGAQICGLMIMTLHYIGVSTLNCYRAVLIGYSVFAVIMCIIYSQLSPRLELENVPKKSDKWFGNFGLHRKESKIIVARLSALFTIDAFAGGFVMQSILVDWFHIRWHVSPSLLGAMLLGANILSGVSALLASPLANKIGLINTMVFTHIPSNVLLILIPLMPYGPLAIIVLLLRFCISQMDVPTRQAYTALVVQPDERSAAAGITNIVRSVGMSISPFIVGYLLSDPHNVIVFSLPFFIAGFLKIVYDLALYYSMKNTPAPGEAARKEVVVMKEDEEQPPEDDDDQETLLKKTEEE